MPSNTVSIRVTQDTKKLIKEMQGKTGLTEAQTVSQFVQQEGQVGPLTRNSGKQQGTVYIASNGTFYTSPPITVQTIRDMLENPYISSKIDKRLLTFFPGQVVIESFNPAGKIDPEETNNMQKICSGENFMLNEAIIQAYYDCEAYGCSIFNPCWNRSRVYNEITPNKLRHLPSWSFNWAPISEYHTWSPLLRGIIIGSNGEPEYWQRKDEFSYEIEQITNIFVIKNPIDELLSGNSKIVRLASTIEMLKFVINTGMQVVNQSGAPFFFIIVTNPREATHPDVSGVGDIDYAQQIISKGSKDTRFLLRDNMTIQEVNMTPGVDILKYEEALSRVIDRFFDIADQISKSKGGAIVGGSSRSELDIHNQAAEGIHNWLLPQFENLLNQYYYLNGYPDGWGVKLTYQMPKDDRTQQKIAQAELLAKYKLGDMKTIYELLPDVEPINEKREQEIIDFWAKFTASNTPEPPTVPTPDQGNIPDNMSNMSNNMPDMTGNPFAQKSHTHKTEGEGEPLDPLAKEIDDELQQEIDELSGAILKGLSD